MINDTTKQFLCKRMIELREKNGKSITDMATLIGYHKSTISRVERGEPSYKTILETAELYCDTLGLTVSQKELFLRGNKVIVVDTSALLKYAQLIDELSKEYSSVIVPKIVIDELNNIKDHNTKGLASKAWLILRTISTNPSVKTKDYDGNSEYSNDTKIIAIAKEVAIEYSCEVDIITYDTDFAARLKCEELIHSLYLEEYIATKQSLVNMTAINKINQYYADNYTDIAKKLGITIPEEEDINSFLLDGNTLIISAVRNKHVPINQRKEKIKWLMSLGADINRRDSGKYHFPPLTHSIQISDFEMFKFLLHECNANPNIGSRNPHDYGKIRQKNDGNMPLMVAAWDNKIEFVKELCKDSRISINQQDGNGFTALIKACYWGWLECRDILISYGADTKIIDRDGYTAEERYNEFLETGRRKNTSYKKNNGGNRRK